NDTSSSAIYTLSLHDALPISVDKSVAPVDEPLAPVHEQVELLQSVSSSAPIQQALPMDVVATDTHPHPQTPVRSSTQSSIQNPRSEEHTSELQSRENLVCRLL